MIENQQNRENMEIEDILHKSKTQKIF